MLSPRNSEPASPLAGIRIVDLTSFLSGPFCTQILGDLGAEVIKVEPFEGDSSRAIPPHFVGPDSAYYLATNRCKKSIALNLKSPKGVDIAQRLIASADVVVENFRPGVCARLGLDPAIIRQAQPALIWASISGFGQTGPNRDLPAYDMIVQAMSGVMSLTGEPGRPATRLGIPAGDLIAGMYCAIGILAALRGRSEHGDGATLDISMLDGQLSMLSYQGVYNLVAGVQPGRQGARHDSIPTYRSFIASDGRELVVTANTERMWSELCKTLRLEQLTRDPRFANAGLRLANKHDLWALLEPAFLDKPAAEWVSLLSAAGVPAGLIKTVSEAIDDARVSGRGMVLDVAHEDGRRANLLGNPIKVVGHEGRASFPPRLSQDADDYLAGLGFKTSEVAELRAEGVLLKNDTAQ